MIDRQVAVVVVGAGPAGLSAAIALRERGLEVVVLERESEAGGIPRHSDHLGYGVSDLRRLMTGPAYARRYVRAALTAGVDLRTETSALDIDPDRGVTTLSPSGYSRLRSGAVVLATGCRERPRSARLVPGDRPAGVYTTGSLQQRVALQLPVGRRAVVVGAEHVAFSAIVTLRHAGARTVAVVTEQPTHQTAWWIALATAGVTRTPVRTDYRLARVAGRERVQAVKVMSLDRDETTTIQCDCVVFTGDWVPENELARKAGVGIDARTGGPHVDSGLRTDRPGVFAAGNILRGADTADACAIEGRHVAGSVVEWLASGVWPTPGPTLRPGAGVDWVVPGAAPVSGTAGPPRDRLVLRAATPMQDAWVQTLQGERLLWEGRPRLGSLPGSWIATLVRRHQRWTPNRTAWIPAGFLQEAAAERQEVVVRVVERPGTAG